MTFIFLSAVWAFTHSVLQFTLWGIEHDQRGVMKRSFMPLNTKAGN